MLQYAVDVWELPLQDNMQVLHQLAIFHLKQSVIRELPIDDGIFIAKVEKMPRRDWEHFLIL